MKRLALTFILLIGAQTVAAAEPGEAQRPDFSIAVGGGINYAPDYLGSENYKVYYFPYIDLRYKQCFATPYRGVGCELYSQHGLKVDAALGWDFGRDEDENARLTGLGEIDPYLEGRLNAQYRFFGPGYIEVGIFNDLFDNGHEGFLIKPKIGMSQRFPDQGLMIDSSVFMDFGSEDYMQSYFGISQDQASRSIYSPFNAEAGWRSAGLGLSMIQDIAEGLSVNISFRYTELLADAKDSPIVESEGQYSTGFAIVYRFE